jgi:hypothetical protein
MTLIKKRDVESYFASRNRSGVHLKTPRSQPDATGFSGGGAGRAELVLRQSAAQPLRQPSSIGLPKAAPVLLEPASGIVNEPVSSKSTQA